MLNQSLLPELQHEMDNTRKMLERVPFESFSWQPHPKSMTLERLATHVAVLPLWVMRAINMNELNLAENRYAPPKFTSNEEMLKAFDEKVAEATETLKNASDEQLREVWTMRRGDQILFTLPRIAVIRSMAINHIIHHRGQLSVYLRLLDVPVPGMYGPSADEGNF